MSRFHEPGTEGIRLTGHWQDTGNGAPSLSLMLNEPGANAGMTAALGAPERLVTGIAPGGETAEPEPVSGLAGVAATGDYRPPHERWGGASIAGAVLLHAAIAGVLLWHFSADNTVRLKEPAAQVMHATVVEDPAASQARAQEAQQQREQQRQLEQQREQQQREQQHQQQLTAARERARQQALQRQQQRAHAEAQARQAAAQARAQAQREAEQKAAAQAAAQKAAADKAAQARREAESNVPEQLSQAPVATNRVSPTYPALAQQRGMQGSVTVRFTIRKDGSVDPASLQAVNSTNSMFEKAALDAVRQWRFKPRSRPGIAEVPVRFELED